jgi:TetR/AcrR family transcriptional repressor of nem operon
MTDTISTIERILAAAEKRMRQGGFHGFSFREIAADVGIKSASVHHHFPTKEDLGAAVVRNYTERFLEILGDPGDTSRSPTDLQAHFIASFRKSFGKERRMCLCGHLSSDASSMPDAVNAAVRDFFERNLDWISAVLRRAASGADAEEIRRQAERIVGIVEGAMLLSHGLGDARIFDRIVGILDDRPFGQAEARVANDDLP